MYVLLMLPTANAVPSLTGTLLRTSARPLVPVQVVPSRKITETETPGIPRRRWSRSSSAWRRTPIGTVVIRGLESPSAAPRRGGIVGAGLAEGEALVAAGAGDAGLLAAGDRESEGGGVGVAAATATGSVIPAAPTALRPAQPPSRSANATTTSRPAVRVQRRDDGAGAGMAGSGGAAASGLAGRGSG